MSKPNQRTPWFHASSGYWCAWVDGKRRYLSKDEVAAAARLKQLLDQSRSGSSADRFWLEEKLARLSAEFLKDAQIRRSAPTHRSYQEMLTLALKVIGPTITVGAVRKFHLTKLEQWMTEQAYSPSTIFRCIHAVQRIFAWAVEQDFIEHSPLAGFRKPRPRNRTRIFTPAEFNLLLRKSDAPFRRVLVALRMTGCRPGEMQKLRWCHVRISEGVWVLPEHKTLHRQKQPAPRVIAMPEPILKLVKWLARKPHAPNDNVFLNRDGKPWTRYALLSRMTRLRKRAGLNHVPGENLMLYSLRHTFATEAVGKVSDHELALLMGHEDTQMARKYLHLNTQRIREIRQKLSGA